MSCRAETSPQKNWSEPLERDCFTLSMATEQFSVQRIVTATAFATNRSERPFQFVGRAMHTLRERSRKVDPKKRQRYSNEFRREAVERMRVGDNIVGLAREMGVCRRVLYNWRDQLDESNAPPTRTRELMLRKQILRLKRLLANKTLEVDFFRHALQRVGARRRQNFHPGDKASTTR